MSTVNKACYVCNSVHLFLSFFPICVKVVVWNSLYCRRNTLRSSARKPFAEIYFAGFNSYEFLISCLRRALVTWQTNRLPLADFLSWTLDSNNSTYKGLVNGWLVYIAVMATGKRTQLKRHNSASDMLTSHLDTDVGNQAQLSTTLQPFQVVRKKRCKRTSTNNTSCDDLHASSQQLSQLTSESIDIIDSIAAVNTTVPHSTAV